MHDTLHWLEFPQRITYKLALLVYKCLHGLAPEYLTTACVLLSTLSAWSTTPLFLWGQQTSHTEIAHCFHRPSGVLLVGPYLVEHSSSSATALITDTRTVQVFAQGVIVCVTVIACALVTSVLCYLCVLRCLFIIIITGIIIIIIISYGFWDIQRQIMAWPWNLGYIYRSLKVIVNTLQRSKAWVPSYGSFLYHFRDKTRYWPKIAIFYTHTTSFTFWKGNTIIHKKWKWKLN